MRLCVDDEALLASSRPDEWINSNDSRRFLITCQEVNRRWADDLEELRVVFCYPGQPQAWAVAPNPTQVLIATWVLLQGVHMMT